MSILSFSTNSNLSLNIVEHASSPVPMVIVVPETPSVSAGVLLKYHAVALDLTLWAKVVLRELPLISGWDGDDPGSGMCCSYCSSEVIIESDGNTSEWQLLKSV